MIEYEALIAHKMHYEAKHELIRETHGMYSTIRICKLKIKMQFIKETRLRFKVYLRVPTEKRFGISIHANCDTICQINVLV